MNKLILLIALTMSFSVIANDKIAYIAHQINVEGSYILCEKEYSDFEMTSYLVASKLMEENLENWLDMVEVEGEGENKDKFCAKLSIGLSPITTHKNNEEIEDSI